MNQPGPGGYQQGGHQQGGPQHPNPYAPAKAELRMPGQQDESLKWVVPVGRSWLAIIAGYLGLLSLLIVPAPLSVLVSIAALFHLKNNPDKTGHGRAYFGLVMGGVFTMVWLFILTR